MCRQSFALTGRQVAVVLVALAGICPQVWLSTEELHAMANLGERYGLTIYDAARPFPGAR